MSISIITYNTAGLNVFTKDFFLKEQRLVELIHEKDVDVINLQEVILHHHLHYLKKELSEFPYVIYRPSFYGALSGLVTFSRLPLVFKSFHQFRENGDLFNRSIISKLAQRGMLISQFTGTNIYLVNTHFSPNMINQWDSNNRYIQILQSQSDELHTVLKRYKEAQFLISGDFNTPKSYNFLYRNIVKDGFIDIFADIDRSTHLGDIVFKEKDSLQIDYILASATDQSQIQILKRGFVFDQKEIIKDKKIYLSDHIGLEATIEFATASLIS